MMSRIPGLGADPEFAKLWVGGFVSSLGFHVSILAMQLTAAAVLGATPFEMGLLGAAQFLPRLAFGLVAGAWVDRVHRRPLMVATDLGRAALLASVPLAFVAGRLSVPQLAVVSFGVGTLSLVFSVASNAYLPGLVGRERLVDANSRMSAAEAVAQIGGPNLAGLAVQVLTAPIAIALDAASYVVSALCIGWIRRREPDPPPPDRRRPILGEIREGLAVITSSPILRTLIIAGANIGLFTGGFRGALIVLYLVELGVSPVAFGVIYGVGGAAALVGAVLARRTARRLGIGPVLVGSQLLAAALALVVPLAGFVPPDARLAFLIAGQIGLGLVAPTWAVVGGSLQQAVTPDRLLGRVNATQHVVLGGMNPLGAIVGGAIASIAGVQVTLVLAAMGAALSAAILASSPVRGLRALPHIEPAGAPGVPASPIVR